jgi:4-carboxymuconolactone decarboxylase
MAPADFSSPRKAAAAFTPELSSGVESPLHDKVWADPALSPRDRSLATVTALIVGGHTDELPLHLKRAVTNGVTKAELGALITHLAFYVGFQAAISASAIAHSTLEEP